MDDYIFLIIAVAISIFAAINKSKKNKMADNPEEERVKPRNFFMDQLLGEDFLAEQEEKKTPPVRVKQAPANVIFKSSNDIQKGLNYQLPRFKSTLPNRPKRETISTFQRQKEEEKIIETEETNNYLEDFSLRKAFVYSQIMEPKYWIETQI